MKRRTPGTADKKCLGQGSWLEWAEQSRMKWLSAAGLGTIHIGFKKGPRAVGLNIYGFQHGGNRVLVNVY